MRRSLRSDKNSHFENLVSFELLLDKTKKKITFGKLDMVARYIKAPDLFIRSFPLGCLDIHKTFRPRTEVVWVENGYFEGVFGFSNYISINFGPK